MENRREGSLENRRGGSLEEGRDGATKQRENGGEEASRPLSLAKAAMLVWVR